VVVGIAVALLATSIGIEGQMTGRFTPDWTFRGSALTGMQQIGQAAWRAENGEIIGTPKSADGGWLLLPSGYQDVQFAGNVRCTGECTAGVMVRSEKTASGIKGLYAVVTGTERAAAAVTVDDQGRIASREALTRGAGGQARFAPALPPPGAEAARGGGAAGGRGAARGGGGAGGRGGDAGGRGGAGRAAGAAGGAAAPTFVSMFPTPPSNAYRPNDWNTFELLVDANVFRSGINGSLGALAIDPETGTFGPVALHVAGTGEVRFRNLALKDLNPRVTPTEVVASRFRKVHFEDFYHGWSAAAGDFNRDGTLDITIGNRYYLGPDFTVAREVYQAQVYNPATQYSPAMVNYAFDVTGDGWDDILVAESRAPALYVNPKGESRRWTRHTVFPQVTSESIEFMDVNADGKPDAIFVGGGLVQWATVDPANPTGPWKSYAVSTPGPWGVHGIGAGDVNADGRVDIVGPHGWWEQPAAGATQVPWTLHQAAFGRNGNAGGNMAVYDVNGDKLPDVVTAFAAHGFGLGWYEQKRDSSGKSTWTEHVIMNDFASKNAGGVTVSELHAMTSADIDGDGVKDIITGRRHWAHLDSYTDPDPHGPGVLYWYRTVRNPKAPGGAEFVPELIHNRSGVGSMIQVADMNKDGAVDILAGTNRGGHVFFNTPGGRRGGAAAPAPAGRGRGQ
jgi:hypothetical protein